MIARLLISTSLEVRIKEIKKILLSHIPEGTNHPDLLYLSSGEKIGIAESKKIKGHFSLKPYSAKSRIVVLEDVSGITPEAQNAILKTIEELPNQDILILGSNSDSNLLPTVLSRCQIIHLDATGYDTLEIYHNKYTDDLDKLLNASTEDRFVYIEKLKNREEFLHFLTIAFRKMLHEQQLNTAKQKEAEFLKELLLAEKWAKQNVNIRAILEYLMLVMPYKK